MSSHLGKKNLKISKEFLHKEYTILGKTHKQIAKENNCSGANIYFLMKKYNIKARISGRQRPRLKNQIFGKVKVVKACKGKDNKHPLWLCICDCGKRFKTTSNCLINKTQSCPKCSIIRTAAKSWKGHGEISGQFWSQIKWCAICRNLELNITKEYIWKLFLKQHKKCSLSGVDICITNNSDRKKGKQTASLDRIDSNKGYIRGNVQWIHKQLNPMKMAMKQKDFLMWCKLVTKYQEDKQCKNK